MGHHRAFRPESNCLGAGRQRTINRDLAPNIACRHVGARRQHPAGSRGSPYVIQAGVQTCRCRWPRQKGFVAVVDRGGFDFNQQVSAGSFGGGGNLPDFKLASFSYAYCFHCVFLSVTDGLQRPSESHHNVDTNFSQVRIFLLVSFYEVFKPVPSGLHLTHSWRQMESQDCLGSRTG